MKKINENTKIILTVGQLKRLVKESINRLRYSNVYLIKLNKSVESFKNTLEKFSNDDFALRHAINDIIENGDKQDWTVLYDFGPLNLRNVNDKDRYRNKAREYERKDPDSLIVAISTTSEGDVLVRWANEQFRSFDPYNFYVDRNKSGSEDADIEDIDTLTDTDFCEVCDELEYKLLDNAGCGDLKDDSGIERFRDEVIHPAVNAFFNDGKTVENKEEITDYVEGDPNPYDYYEDKDPFIDG